MKATDIFGQDIERIERMQRAAMGSLNILRQVEEAQKMMALTSAYSAAQDVLNLDNRWKNEVEHLTRTHLAIDPLSSYRTAMEGLSATNSALDATRGLNENAGLVSALSFVNASLGNVASKIANESEVSRRLLHEQLGYSTAQTLASALASERDIASIKGYTASTVSKAWERDAIESLKGLQPFVALAHAAGTASIEKALASSIGNIASQYPGQLNVKDRLREMVEGMSTFDLATTASLARYHGIDGLARQMAALGLEASEYLDDEDDGPGQDGANTLTFESRLSALPGTSLDVFRQILINIIAAYIWTIFIASTLPNPDLDAQNKKIAKIESLIEKLPQLIESQVEAITRRQLFAVETLFVVKERTARLRTSPEAGSGVLALAFPNQKLKLLEERGKWIRVEFYDYLAQSTREGWILKKYCTRLPSSVVNAHQAIGEFRGAGKEGTVEHLLADRQADRERELDAALAETRADLAAGRFVQESPEEHVVRVTSST